MVIGAWKRATAWSGDCGTCSQANRRGRGMSHFMNAKLARSSSARQPLTGSTLAKLASLQKATDYHNVINECNKNVLGRAAYGQHISRRGLPAA